MIEYLKLHNQAARVVDYVLIAEVDRLLKVHTASIPKLLSTVSKICEEHVTIMDTTEEQNFWIRGYGGINDVFKGQWR